MIKTTVHELERVKVQLFRLMEDPEQPGGVRVQAAKTFLTYTGSTGVYAAEEPPADVNPQSPLEGLKVVG